MLWLKRYVIEIVQEQLNGFGSIVRREIEACDRTASAIAPFTERERILKLRG
jgi:hypothetical protein